VKTNSSLDADIAGSTKTTKLFKKPSHLRRWIVVAISLAVIAAGIIIWTKLATSDSVQYKTQNVSRGDITVIVTTTGTLKPTKTVDVGCEVSGTIKSIEVDYNSKVKVGQILAKLDTTKLDAQVTQSKAALDSAKAKILQTKATVSETRSKLEKYEHVRQLSNNKVPSQSEFDAAQAAFDRAKAEETSAVAAEAQAKASLDAYQTDLSKAVIYSPINGIVLTRNIEPGQTVAASFETPVLFTLAEDLTQMELHVDVDEADIGQVKDGQEAIFSVDAYPNREFKAQIIQTRYGSKTVDGVVTYETVLKVDNSDLSLRPGMTATADIVVQKVQDALLIPNTALRFTMPTESGKTSSRGLVGALLPRPPVSVSQKHEKTNEKKNQHQVWTLKEGQPVAVSLTTGAENGVMTEVLSGDITEGTPLIVERVSEGK
jgi:HlyD family secretion protein